MFRAWKTQEKCQTFKNERHELNGNGNNNNNNRIEITFYVKNRACIKIPSGILVWPI